MVTCVPVNLRTRNETIISILSFFSIRMRTRTVKRSQQKRS